MIIGGKEFHVGDRVRIVNAKSILHYKYGMNGDTDHHLTGITGIIESESHYTKNARANLKVDEPYSKGFTRGKTRLFCDDEVELLEADK